MKLAEQTSLDHDRDIFETVRDTVEKPTGVLAVAYEPGEDSYDDPAAWIWVAVKPELNPSNKRMKALNAYTTRLRDELLEHGILGYPFVRITEQRPRIPASRRAARR